MLIASFSTGPWETNCYVIAPVERSACVIVDPGPDAAAVVETIVESQGLTPVAVLATHGHLDHIAEAHRICATYDIGCWIHADDRGLLTDPVAGLGSDLAPLVEQLLGSRTLPEPAQVHELSDGDQLSLAGLRFDVRHAPGHTPGSVLYEVANPGRGPNAPDVLLSGDVLFAGAIGRTDLPGGSEEAMRKTLVDVVLGVDDSRVVLPGHGLQTTMARERRTNPYLAHSYLT
ncbi:MAG: MBL fold metallo-hydrolase [Propionibacteriales bacterium]|nr:MBL fold metallo-hydrolase [Propionibacteriales bacterium]